MFLELKINEKLATPAWLKTLYDMVEELNCTCNTHMEETFNRSFKHYTRTRIIEIYGSDTMISWLKLRMERYDHMVDTLNNKPEVQQISSKIKENDDQ